MPTRKDAIRAFKQQTPSRGAYAIRCAASGRAWVGVSPNLDAVRNRAWFMLRAGDHRNRELQAEWHARGEAAFTFEVLETLEADVVPLVLPDRLKALQAAWTARLDAVPLLA